MEESAVEQLGHRSSIDPLFLDNPMYEQSLQTLLERIKEIAIGEDLYQNEIPHIVKYLDEKEKAYLSDNLTKRIIQYLPIFSQSQESLLLELASEQAELMTLIDGEMAISEEKLELILKPISRRSLHLARLASAAEKNGHQEISKRLSMLVKLDKEFIKSFRVADKQERASLLTPKVYFTTIDDQHVYKMTVVTAWKILGINSVGNKLKHPGTGAHYVQPLKGTFYKSTVKDLRDKDSLGDPIKTGMERMMGWYAQRFSKTKMVSAAATGIKLWNIPYFKDEMNGDEIVYKDIPLGFGEATLQAGLGVGLNDQGLMADEFIKFYHNMGFLLKIFRTPGKLESLLVAWHKFNSDEVNHSIISTGDQKKLYQYADDIFKRAEACFELFEERYIPKNFAEIKQAEVEVRRKKIISWFSVASIDCIHKAFELMGEAPTLFGALSLEQVFILPKLLKTLFLILPKTVKKKKCFSDIKNYCVNDFLNKIDPENFTANVFAMLTSIPTDLSLANMMVLFDRVDSDADVNSFLLVNIDCDENLGRPVYRHTTPLEIAGELQNVHGVQLKAFLPFVMPFDQGPCTVVRSYVTKKPAEFLVYGLLAYAEQYSQKVDMLRYFGNVQMVGKRRSSFIRHSLVSVDEFMIQFSPDVMSRMIQYTINLQNELSSGSQNFRELFRSSFPTVAKFYQQIEMNFGENIETATFQVVYRKTFIEELLDKTPLPSDDSHLDQADMEYLKKSDHTEEEYFKSRTRSANEIIFDLTEDVKNWVPVKILNNRTRHFSAIHQEHLELLDHCCKYFPEDTNVDIDSLKRFFLSRRKMSDVEIIEKLIKLASENHYPNLLQLLISTAKTRDFVIDRRRGDGSTYLYLYLENLQVAFNKYAYEDAILSKDRASDFISRVENMIRVFSKWFPVDFNEIPAHTNRTPIVELVKRFGRTLNKFERMLVESVLKVLMEYGISLDCVSVQQEESGYGGQTPLGSAIENSNWSLAKLLVNYGAGATCHIRSLRRLVEQLKKEGDEGLLYIKKLRELNSRLAYDEALDMLLPAMDQEGALEVRGTVSGKRYIPKEVAEKFMDLKTRELLKKAIGVQEYGRHCVIRVEHNGLVLFVKAYPEIAGYEKFNFMIRNTIAGHGSVFSELFNFAMNDEFGGQPKYYPVLVTAEAKGENFNKVLRRKKYSEKNKGLLASEVLKNLDLRDYSDNVLSELLLFCEDGKPDQYQVSAVKTSKGTRYRLTCVDGDRILVKAKDVKSILFCLDEFRSTPIHPDAVANFLSLDPSVLQRILKDTLSTNNNYRDVFASNKEKQRIYRSKESLLDIPFTKEMAEGVFDHFIKMQDALKKNPKMTGLELLTYLDKDLGERHERMHRNQTDVLSRFNGIKERLYTIRDGQHKTKTNTKSLLEKLGIKVEFGDPKKYDSFEMLSRVHSHLMSIISAHRNTGMMLDQIQMEKSFEVQFAFPEAPSRLIPYFKLPKIEQMSLINKFGAHDKREEDGVLESKIFEVLSYKPSKGLSRTSKAKEKTQQSKKLKFKELTLCDFRFSDQKIIQAAFKNQLNLTVIDLSGSNSLVQAFCSMLTTKTMTKMMPDLSNLTINGTNVTELDLSRFKKLSHLNAETCIRLQSVKLFQPKHINLTGAKSLIKMEVSFNDQLYSVNLSGTKNLPGYQIQKLLRGVTTLRLGVFTGCNPFHTRHLIKNIFNRYHLDSDMFSTISSTKFLEFNGSLVSNADLQWFVKLYRERVDITKDNQLIKELDLTSCPYISLSDIVEFLSSIPIVMKLIMQPRWRSEATSSLKSDVKGAGKVPIKANGIVNRLKVISEHEILVYRDGYAAVFDLKKPEPVVFSEIWDKNENIRNGLVDVFENIGLYYVIRSQGILSVHSGAEKRRLRVKKLSISGAVTHAALLPRLQHLALVHNQRHIAVFPLVGFEAEDYTAKPKFLCLGGQNSKAAKVEITAIENFGHQSFVVGLSDGSVELWQFNGNSVECTNTFTPSNSHVGAVTHLAELANNHLLIVQDNHEIFVWDTVTFERVLTANSPVQIGAVLALPGGFCLAVGLDIVTWHLADETYSEYSSHKNFARVNGKMLKSEAITMALSSSGDLLCANQNRYLYRHKAFTEEFNLFKIKEVLEEYVLYRADKYLFLHLKKSKSGKSESFEMVCRFFDQVCDARCYAPSGSQTSFRIVPNGEVSLGSIYLLTCRLCGVAPAEELRFESLSVSNLDAVNIIRSSELNTMLKASSEQLKKLVIGDGRCLDFPVLNTLFTECEKVNELVFPVPRTEGRETFLSLSHVLPDDLQPYWKIFMGSSKLIFANSQWSETYSVNHNNTGVLEIQNSIKLHSKAIPVASRGDNMFFCWDSGGKSRIKVYTLNEESGADYFDVQYAIEGVVKKSIALAQDKLLCLMDRGTLTCIDVKTHKNVTVNFRDRRVNDFLKSRCWKNIYESDFPDTVITYRDYSPYDLHVFRVSTMGSEDNPSIKRGFNDDDIRITCVATSFLNAVIITAGKKGEINVWNYETEEKIFTFAKHQKDDGSVNAMSVLDHQKRVASASSKKIRIWDLNGGAELRVINTACDQLIFDARGGLYAATENRLQYYVPEMMSLSFAFRKSLPPNISVDIDVSSKDIEITVLSFDQITDDELEAWKDCKNFLEDILSIVDPGITFVRKGDDEFFISNFKNDKMMKDMKQLLESAVSQLDVVELRASKKHRLFQIKKQKSRTGMWSSPAIARREKKQPEGKRKFVVGRNRGPSKGNKDDDRPRDRDNDNNAEYSGSSVFF